MSSGPERTADNRSRHCCCEGYLGLCRTPDGFCSASLLVLATLWSSISKDKLPESLFSYQYQQMWIYMHHLSLGILGTFENKVLTACPISYKRSQRREHAICENMKRFVNPSEIDHPVILTWFSRVAKTKMDFWVWFMAGKPIIKSFCTHFLCSFIDFAFNLSLCLIATPVYDVIWDIIYHQTFKSSSFLDATKLWGSFQDWLVSRLWK